MKLIVFLSLICMLSFTPFLLGNTLTHQQRQEDFDVLIRKLENLHPGLHHFLLKEKWDRAKSQSLKAWLQSQGTREDLVILAKLLHQIRCGHTYVNPWNQEKAIRQEFFIQQGHLPFHFQILAEAWTVSASLHPTQLKIGDQLRSINGVPIAEVQAELLKISKGDGFDIDQRLLLLELDDRSDYHLFDIYFPLLFPYKSSSVDLKVQRDQRELHLRLPLTSKTARRDRLVNERPVWDFQQLSPATGYLKLGSYATWKFKFDWRMSLDQAFNSLQKHRSSSLIIDLRGNSGGMNDVNEELFRRLFHEGLPFLAPLETTRFEVLATEEKAHLETWDQSFFDRRGLVKPIAGGQFQFTRSMPRSHILPHSPNAFRGQLIVLTDGHNSSATLRTATVLKDTGRAKLVGANSGGDRAGTNGGQIAFLRLPHSRLEVDIPLIAYRNPGRSGPVRVDIPIKRNRSDLMQGRDPVLAAALKLVQESPKESAPKPKKP